MISGFRIRGRTGDVCLFFVIDTCVYRSVGCRIFRGGDGTAAGAARGTSERAARTRSACYILVALVEGCR